MLTPGQQLRTLREQLGLTMRDVEVASSRISAKHGNDDFAIPLSRLSDIETKGIVPSIFRLYSLAVIYRRDLNGFGLVEMLVSALVILVPFIYLVANGALDWGPVNRVRALAGVTRTTEASVRRLAGPTATDEPEPSPSDEAA